MEQNCNHIHLFGDPEENFYVLGKRDKDSYSEVYNQISMLCTRNQFMAKVLKTTTELSRRFGQYKSHYNHQEISAYAQGLEKPVDDVLFSLLLPEIVASFNKWTPHLMGIIPGCSSLFVKDSNTGDVIHTRILDYALAGPFEKFERSILAEFKGRNKTFSYSTSGMPFPAMTALNDKGLSLALHYKHGQYFDMDGQSIFFITSQIMNHCSNIREAIKFIKTQKSISYWGIYLADASGEVASIDIRGNEIYQEKFDLKDHSYLYFNNRPLLEQADQKNIQPFGNSEQCNMRAEYFSNSIKSTTWSELKDVQLESLKLISKTSSKKINTAKSWKLPTITPSSIQLTSFNLNTNRSLFVPGQSPKYFRGEYGEFKNIFDDIKYKHHKKNSTKVQKLDHFYQGMTRISRYQSAIDLGDIPRAYHQIQMAIEYLHGYPEEFIAKFYFTISQYIYEADKRDLTYLFQSFEELEDKLPPYLEDHRKLFILRLAKIIGHDFQNESKHIKNPDLKKLYLKEYNLNAISIKGLKYLIFPRIEILDIIYAY